MLNAPTCVVQACWAFGTTGSVEGAHFLATKQLVSLSEQQLVDCSSADGNKGCKGGDAVFSYRYIDDQAACDYGRGAPPKLYDDFIYHAELIVSRAYFFSRWCVNAGIAIDKPIRTRGKRGKKNKGRR